MSLKLNSCWIKMQSNSWSNLGLQALLQTEKSSPARLELYTPCSNQALLSREVQSGTALAGRARNSCTLRNPGFPKSLFLLWYIALVQGWEWFLTAIWSTVSSSLLWISLSRTLCSGWESHCTSLVAALGDSQFSTRYGCPCAGSCWSCQGTQLCPVLTWEREDAKPGRS